MNAFFSLPRNNAAANRLIQAGVPMMKQLPNNRWLSIRVTKKDRFYRFNGKVVPKGFLSLLVDCH